MTIPYDLDAIIAKTGTGAPERRGLAALIPDHLREKGRGMVESLQRFKEMRLDGWINDVTGHGTTRDKTTYGYVLPDRLLTDPELSALYHHDDMAGRMVDAIPQEMLREGFAVETGVPELNALAAEKHREIGTRGHLQDGQRWGRCFGGGATLIGCDDGRPADMPLMPERARDLTYLYTMDRRLVWPLTYYSDRASPNLGRVEKYIVTTVGASSGEAAMSNAIVHESRLILHRGMSTAAQERQRLASWDLSVYQRAFGALRQFNTGWQSTENLMADGSQAVYTIGGLQAIIAAGGEELLRERMRAMDQFRSVVRGIVLDADAGETFERKSASLEGWHQTLQQQMIRLAAAVEMPVTILMGQSPAGMNATGESDFRWFYDRIRSMQTNILAPMIERLTAIWLRTKAGREAMDRALRNAKQPAVRGILATFPDLWRETPKDRAARELSIAQRDKVYVDANVFSPDKVALTRGRVGGFDQEIVLTDAEAVSLEKRVAADLVQVEADDAPIPEGESPEAPSESPEGPAVEAAPADVDKPDVKLAPTDAATVITVNEARASMNLPPFQGPDGKLTLSEYKAKNASTIAAAAKAEGGTAPGESPPPSPFGGGFPPRGGAAETEEEIEPPSPPTPGLDEEKGANLSARAGKTAEEILEEDDDEDRQDGVVSPTKTLPRTFTLHRKEDESGVSGTGDVAHGCLFEDGTVAMRWRTATASTTVFESWERVLAVHGHGGKTTIRWHDERSDAITFALAPTLDDLVASERKARG